MAIQAAKYSPRWLYTIFSWIQRTPLGGGLLGIAWIVGLAALYHWRAWQMGLVPQGEYHRYLLGMGFWATLTVFAVMNLDRIAESCLRDFGLLAVKTQKEMQRITHNFISIPEREALLATLAGLLIYGPVAYLTYPVSFPGLFTIYPILTVSILIIIQAPLVSIFMFRCYRQLRLVRQLYRQLPKVSLFNLTPIYALSRYTSWIAIFLVLFIAGGSLIAATTAESLSFGVPIYTSISLFAFLIFLLPLREIRQRLSSEKARMVSKYNLQQEIINSKIQQAVDQNKFAKLGELRTAAGTLKEQLDLVQKVPTWPWNPGTLEPWNPGTLEPWNPGTLEPCVIY